MNNRNSYGVYLIIESGKVIYIGIDKHINKDLRLKQHLAIRNYSKQLINSYIQSSDKETWKYEVLVDNVSRLTARRIEHNFIKFFKPLYNIIGGRSGQKG